LTVSSTSPEIIVIEDVPREKGFISSKKLEEKGIEKIVNQVRYNRLEKKLIELSQQSNIEYAQPIYIYNTAEWSRSGDKDTPNDFGQDPSALEGNHWYYEQSKLREMWKDQDCLNNGVSCGGSAEVIVAVIDTGLAFEDHTSAWADIGNDPFVFSKLPDMFSGESINLWTNTGEIPNNNIDDDNNDIVDDYHGFNADNQVYCKYMWDGCNDVLFAESGHPNDDIGHGTTVTGLIASLVDNSSGSISPAHKVTIMPIKANTQKADSFDSFTLIESINYAVANGADIINLSLAGSGHDPAFEIAINNAHNAGVLVVAASGNFAGPVLYPAKYDNVIAVGAVNADNTKSSYSSYGPELDLVAYVGDGGVKGDAVYQGTYTCASTIPKCFSPDNTNTLRYTQFSTSYATGTSFASPQVAAAAAIIKSNNPGITMEEMRLALISSTNDINTPGFDNTTGNGVLDYRKANSYDKEDMDINTNYFGSYRDDTNTNTWIVVGNPNPDNINMNLNIYNKVDSTKRISAGGQFTYRFPLSNGKPVKIISDGSVYTTHKMMGNGSLSEFAGISASQLSSKYYFGSYRDDSKANTWIVVGNADTVSTNVNISIGGVLRSESVTIEPGEQKTFRYPGLAAKPVEIESSGELIYTTHKMMGNGSLSEFAGIPISQLDSKYYFGSYRDDSNANTWIVVGNADVTSTSVNVKIGGILRSENEIIEPGEQKTFRYPGLAAKPVEIESSGELIYTTHKMMGNGSLSEFAGIPVSQLSNKYYFGSYRDDSNVNTWIVVGNAGVVSTSIDIKIGGIVRSEDVVIEPGEQQTFRYPGLAAKPIEVESTGGLIYTTHKMMGGNSLNEYPGIHVEL